ncbi:hypothetical protein NX059_010458 [Plenodomus lindquistii]|nr:hypothetical protein NX059_010458 [Plenodomus lindquistii]
MSTLHVSGVKHPHAHEDDAIGRQSRQRASDLAFTPRSALNDRALVDEASIFSGNSTADNLNIDLPLYSRATLAMEIVRDDHQAPSAITRRLSGSDAGTTRELLQEFQNTTVQPYTAGTPGQRSCSPRKSLPSHWLPKSSGPNLATAQRAKERSHKKDSHNGSPIDAKTLRGARSSTDLNKTHGVESPTYLTKEALAAVENDLASPTSTHGVKNLHRSTSKPSWRSPTTSPLRSSPGQHVNAIAKTSPTRAALLNVGSSSFSHSRAPSSVAASCGTFHTANESPVRSPSGTDMSFQSAPEHFEDNEIPNLKLDTDNDVLQPSRHHDSVSPMKQKFATVGKTGSMKPRLALHIPLTSSIADATLAATADTFTTNASPPGAEGPRTASRIPRVTGSARTGGAYGATRSSALKQTQSLRSLAGRTNLRQSQVEEPHHIPLPETPATRIHRHVRTVNDSGETPILSRHTVREEACPTLGLAEIQNGCTTSSSHTSKHLEQLESSSTSANPGSQSESIHSQDCNGDEQSSRPTSAVTVKASPLLGDPVPTDSAIIYSRKKGGDMSVILGTASYSTILGLTTVMVAQVPDLTGSIGHPHVREVTDTFEGDSPTLTASTASSVHRLSGSAPELRATAPDFVPQPAPLESAQPDSFELPQPISAVQPEDVQADASTQQQVQQAPWFPLDMSGFDKYGIPWFYYMYPVQFAYDQGFRHGRSKSPRKNKNKKQRQSLPTSTGFSQFPPGTTSSFANGSDGAQTPANTGRRLTSGELMPPPPVPAHRRQQLATEDGSRGDNEAGPQSADVVPGSQDADGPFARQLDVIAQRDILCNTTNVDRPRGRSIDLTNIHNVGPSQEYCNQPYTKYHTVSMRHGRHHHRHAGNGLYNGRGSGGVPLSATTPFPDPAPPQGRPPLGAGGTPAIIGTEACGMIDVQFAGELGGGWPCNGCAPDH